MKKFVCTVCGYVHYGEEPPAVCPVCRQPREKFKEVPYEAPSDKNKIEKKGSWVSRLSKLFRGDK